MAKHHKRSQRSSAKHPFNRSSRSPSSTPQPRSQGKQPIPSSSSSISYSMPAPEASQSVTFSSPTPRTHSSLSHSSFSNGASSNGAPLNSASAHRVSLNGCLSDPTQIVSGTETQGVVTNKMPQKTEATLIPKQRSLSSRILTHWLFWMTTAIAVTAGIGGYAGVTLLTLPSLPNCPNIFWPTASASLRMQCADLAASKNTTKDLLKAIALVDALPNSHPMRGQIDDLIEQWALDILDLADVSFHNGDLDGAISSAKRIPIHLSAYEQVDHRIEEWRSIWDKGEKIYKDAEELLTQEDLRGAFAIAIKLLSVQNDYWKTDRYDQLTELIETSRIDTAKLNEARQLAKGGSVSALLDAMNLVEEIQPESRLYVPARRTLSRFLDDLVALGIKALDRWDAATAMQVSKNLPTGVEFQAKAQDLRELSFALSQSEGGTIEDLEAAVAQAKSLSTNRPLYDKAQSLAGYWELEIQDIQYLTRARELARLGQIPDLQAAIAEARLVRYDNPRGDEAQSAINEWTRDVQTLQDRPYLRDARQLAARGGVRALESAIQRLEEIGKGRPLYSEARQLINGWTAEIETIQDQPYLSDATQFATQGNLPAAIAAAQQVRSGRVLYEEAQSNIRRWRDKVDGDNFLREARDAARQGNASAWARAIRTADRISSGHANRPEADRLISRWGQNILIQAQQTAQVSYEDAIGIANLIPSQSGAYTEAQLQIETWQRAIAERDYWQNPIQPISPVERSERGWKDEDAFIDTIDGANDVADDSGIDTSGVNNADVENSSVENADAESSGVDSNRPNSERGSRVESDRVESVDNGVESSEPTPSSSAEF